MSYLEKGQKLGQTDKNHCKFPSEMVILRYNMTTSTAKEATQRKISCRLNFIY